MDEVLPNKVNFDSDAIFSKEQLFELTPSPSTAPSSSPSAEPSSNTGPSPSTEPSPSPSVEPSTGLATGCDDVRDTYRDNNCCGQPASQSVDTSLTFPVGNTMINPTCSELKGLYEQQSCCNPPIITKRTWCNATNCTSVGSLVP